MMINFFPRASIESGGEELLQFPKPQLATNWKEVQATINELSLLSDNWDGYGALRILPETLENANLVVANLGWRALPTPEVSPNPNGTISFEWESSYGYGLLEVGKTRASFFVQNERQEYVAGRDGDLAGWAWFQTAFELFRWVFPHLELVESRTNINLVMNLIPLLGSLEEESAIGRSSNWGFLHNVEPHIIHYVTK